MIKYFRALWYAVTGRFSAAAEALQSNKHVMSATYDKAIEQGADRFNTVKNAVAQLMSLEQTRLQEIKELQERESKLLSIKKGAKDKMQARINELAKEGLTKEEITKDSDFIRHKGAHADVSSTIAEIEERIAEKEADLEERQEQIATYKAELQSMQRAQEKLREEKTEAIADVAVAQQADAVNSVLASISENTIDKDLAAAREARKNAKAKAKITAELAGNDARLAENEYLAAAEEFEANSELDSLLDFSAVAGEKEGSLEDAKLPG